MIDFLKASIICGLLSVFVLLVKKNAIRSFSDYVLSFFILFQIWTVTIYILIFTGTILEVPFFYRTAAPITFLIPPLGYFYVRSMLFNEQKFNKIDILHLLPFLFFSINYLPFYLRPNSEKIQLIIQIINDKNFSIQKQQGLFSENLFFLFRPIQAIIYLIFQWELIYKFNSKNPNQKIAIQIKLVLNWLKVFTAANTCILLALLSSIALYFSIENLFSNNFLNLIPNLLLGISFFVICTYLLIYPQTLTGLPFVKYKETKSKLIENELDKIPFIYGDYSKEIEQLETYFDNSKAYLKPNLTVSQVAVEANIPIRDLSYIINNYYDKRFNDYLNEKRLSHFLQKLNKETLNNFTIEAVALESGFSSKSSFYRAFNRFYNSTPSEYLSGFEI
ncbi:AraC family transcriptional regulator [Sandaracinomonas limnophila]|uniref:AraC family transcriptional regulator n=1 Tax=Sandaracinomonas limnophila TaxID=1862386 RepID=A0A437PWB5_9BACT|nr:helix-turn-helix domain-containing protein [Sandaracinomonas limnophila]RVU26546.1 AraC family transcriptional regulator [Sandaracinomonas limnophila]